MSTDLEINLEVKDSEMDMDMGKVVTIDGPSASGKTSVSRELARRLGWQWVSTGAFYRGLALAALRLKINLDDEEALVRLSLDTQAWTVVMGDEETKVLFQGQDVTSQIQAEEIGSVASKISHFPKVRSSLLLPQRNCQAITAGLVAEGRDCGTVVFPSADAKVYLTARQEDRAERRAKEQGLSTEATVEAQKQRDLQDSTRKAAPLSVPDEALVVDTTHLNFEETVAAVEKFARTRVLN